MASRQGGRHPHGIEFAGAMQLGEHDGVAAVGLDAIAGPARNDHMRRRSRWAVRREPGGVFFISGCLMLTENSPSTSEELCRETALYPSRKFPS
jgi:hypothetical protein